MSLVDSNGGLTAADVAAVVGGNGNGFGWGDNGAWWLIILFLFFMSGNGWGNNWGGNGGGSADLQRGFDQSAVMNSLNGITTGLCNGFAGVNSGVAGGFAQAEVAANARQVANMNQDFATQTALSGQLNTIAMNQQECCCDNRLAIANLSADIAREACADRTAVSDALKDVIAAQTANTTAMMQAFNNGIQSIQDKMCQQEIDALKAQNANLQTQINLANLQASQNGQTSQLLQDNAAQTASLLRQLNPSPVPAYVVPAPGCYGYGQSGCCGAM